MILVLVTAWVAVKFGINTTNVALKFPFSIKKSGIYPTKLALVPVLRAGPS